MSSLEDYKQLSSSKDILRTNGKYLIKNGIINGSDFKLVSSGIKFNLGGDDNWSDEPPETLGLYSPGRVNDIKIWLIKPRSGSPKGSPKRRTSLSPKRSPKRTSPTRSPQRSKKKDSPAYKQVTTEQYDESSLYSIKDLQGWDINKIITYLVNEADSYQAILQCVVSELDSLQGARAKETANELRELLESVPEDEELTKFVKKSSRKDDDEDESDESSEEEETARPKPRRSPSPKKASPFKMTEMTEALKRNQEDIDKDTERLEKLVKKYDEAVNEKDKTKMLKLSTAISNLAKTLEFDDAYMEDKYEFYGFGQKSRKSNRSPNRRMSRKRPTLSPTLRPTLLPVLAHRRSNLRHKSPLRRKFSRFGTKNPYAAGSSGQMYGLQDGPQWSGVYPMDLNVEGAMPNLLNVKRDYPGPTGAMNRFGFRGLRRRRFSKPLNHPRIRRRSGFGMFQAPSPLTIV